MSTAWPVESLGDVCKIIGGGTPSKDNTAFYSGNIPWATVRDMGKAILDKTELCITQDAVCNSPTNIIPKGNVIIASRVGLGKVCILKNDTAINQDLRAVIPKSDNLLEEYLFWWFCSIADYIVSQGNGATVKGVTLPFLKSLSIPIPPIPEQQRIVGILDAAFEKIDAVQRNAERNLANAKELFQRVLDEEMTPKDGWEKVAFKDLFDIRDGTHDSPQYHAQGHPLITSKNLKSGTLDYNNVKLISDDDFIKINERSKVDRFDLLFAMIGTIGNPIVIEDEPGFAIKNVALFKNKPTQNMYFLKYYLNTSVVHNKMICDAQGSNQKFVGLAYLRNFQTLYPSRLIQDAIVRKLNVVSSRCDSLVCALTSQLQMYTELRQQILAKAFNGEL